MKTEHSTYDYFMAALKDVISRGKMKQSEIANLVGIASQSVNAYVNERKVPGLPKQEAIANACGMSYLEFAAKGKEMLEGEPAKLGTDEPTQKYSVVTGERIEECRRAPATYDVLNEITQLISEKTEAQRELGVFNILFQSSASAVYLVRNGIITYQNLASKRSHGKTIGLTFKEHCTQCESCELDRSTCAIPMAMESCQPVRVHRRVDGHDCLISVTPVYINGDYSFLIENVDVDQFVEEEET